MKKVREDRIKKDTIREIIDDFAKEIKENEREVAPPKVDVIHFRDEMKDGIERMIYKVPLKLLRYRKNNGRIRSDVLSYEKVHGLLDEKSKTAQDIIREFLKQKDPEKTEELKKSIKNSGQRKPAIITCDGFLINGNRRKMVLEMLGKETMRVVILPGKREEGEPHEGGPPTILEIEQIENRYQLQSEGKAEYSNFDRALSMREKINLGMSLKEQLQDDPRYADLNKNDLQKVVKKYEDEYLEPLMCIDRYLEILGREGSYITVARGIGDREGRWQAFYDYNKSVWKKISNKKKMMKLGIRDSDVGKIEEIAFKIIRMRELKGIFGYSKVHKIMRNLGKWIENKDSRKEFFKILDVDFELPKEERYDKDKREYNEREIDKIWGKKHMPEILSHLKNAIDYSEHKRIREKPVDLMEVALKKLNHEDMIIKNIGRSDIRNGRAMLKSIRERAGELEKELYRHEKSLKKGIKELQNKYRKKRK